MGSSRITEEDVYFDNGFGGGAYIIKGEDDWMKDLQKDDPYGVWKEKQNEKEYTEREFDRWYNKMKKEEKWMEKYVR